MFRLLLATALWLTAGFATAERLPEVTSIEARLFFNYSGTLSKPITAKTVLWNAIIGEGNISEPSNSTFVRADSRPLNPGKIPVFLAVERCNLRHHWPVHATSPWQSWDRLIPVRP